MAIIMCIVCIVISLNFLYITFRVKKLSNKIKFFIYFLIFFIIGTGPFIRLMCLPDYDNIENVIKENGYPIPGYKPGVGWIV